MKRDFVAPEMHWQVFAFLAVTSWTILDSQHFCLEILLTHYLGCYCHQVTVRLGHSFCPGDSKKRKKLLYETQVLGKIQLIKSCLLLANSKHIIWSHGNTFLHNKQNKTKSKKHKKNPKSIKFTNKIHNGHEIIFYTTNDNQSRMHAFSFSRNY